MCGVAANLNLRASFHRHESMSPRIHESRMPGAQKVNPSCPSQMKITNTHTHTVVVQHFYVHFDVYVEYGMPQGFPYSLYFGKSIWNPSVISHNIYIMPRVTPWFYLQFKDFFGNSILKKRCCLYLYLLICPIYKWVRLPLLTESLFHLKPQHTLIVCR